MEKKVAHMVDWRSSTMDSGGLCVTTILVQLMPMLLVNSWGSPVDIAGGMWKLLSELIWIPYTV